MASVTVGGSVLLLGGALAFWARRYRREHGMLPPMFAFRFTSKPTPSLPIPMATVVDAELAPHMTKIDAESHSTTEPIA